MRLALFTVVLSYVQLMIGAWLRHLAAGSTGDAFRIGVMFHLALAAAIVGHVLYLAHVVFWRRRDSLLLWPALGLAMLVLIQIALGGGAWLIKYGWPAWFAQYDFAQRMLLVPGGAPQMWTTTAHVATGSLILGLSLLFILRLWRLSAAVPQLPAVAHRQPSLTREAPA
jgi:cytochrome c oxidase assembly protein subunit 15